MEQLRLAGKISISFFRLQLADFRSTVRAFHRLHWHWCQTIGAILCCGGRGGRGSLHPIYLPDKQKHGESNDDEVQNIVNEDAIIQRRCTGRLCRSDTGIFLAGEVDEKVRKIHPAQRYTNRRHENIVDKRRHNFAKRRADDDGYCQINHIASPNELSELVEHDLSSFRVSALFQRTVVSRLTTCSFMAVVGIFRHAYKAGRFPKSNN